MRPLTDKQKKQIGWGVFGALLGITAILLMVFLIPRPAKTGAGGTGDPPKVYGVCYDPGELQGTLEAQRACVLKDLKLIREAGFVTFRTYAPFFKGGEGSYAEVCSEVNGLSVMLGLQDPSEWETLVPILTGAHRNQVYGVCLGNEDVTEDASVLLDAAKKLASVKGVATRIGTAQRAPDILCALDPGNTGCSLAFKNAYEQMRDGLDFLGANVYPGTPNGGPAIASNNATFNRDSVLAQARSLKTLLGDKLVITESGMPWAGACQDGQGNIMTYTRSLQDSLVDELQKIKNIVDSGLFVFMAFDVASKPDIPACTVTTPDGSGERHFGVLDPPSSSRCVRGVDLSEATRQQARSCLPCATAARRRRKRWQK